MNNFSFKKNMNCRICDNNILKTYLDLGAQPPSNSFVNKDELKYEKFFSLIKLYKEKKVKKTKFASNKKILHINVNGKETIKPLSKILIFMFMFIL